MKISKHVIFPAALMALAAGCWSAAATAQDAQQAASPMFITLPPHNIYDFTPSAPPPSVLTTFTSSFVYNAVTYPYTMVGLDPACVPPACHVATPAFIIPIKIHIIGGSTFSPGHVLATFPPETVTLNVKRSPMFVSSTWTLPGTCPPQTCTLPNREYEDAYQKASLWGLGAGVKPSYHDRLVNPPTVVPIVTLTCGTPNCKMGVNPITNMGAVAMVDVNFFDVTCQNAINANTAITPGVVAICLTYDTFLTSGGACCIGGYHSAYGGAGSQTYIYTTWIDPINCVAPCQFAEDTAAFSHETAEWMTDPYINNSVPYTPCNGLIEVGDPLEQHDYVQALTGPPAYSYHVQDLVFLSYFYQAASSALNGWYTFDNEGGYTAPCSHGPARQ
jgi:hypothetical protein